MTSFIINPNSIKWYVANVQEATKPSHEWNGITDYDSHLNDIRAKNKEEYESALKDAWNQTNPLVKAYLKFRGKNPSIDSRIMEPAMLEFLIGLESQTMKNLELRYALKPDTDKAVDISSLTPDVHPKTYQCSDLEINKEGFGNERYKLLLENAFSDAQKSRFDFVSVSEPRFISYRHSDFASWSGKIPIYQMNATFLRKR